MPVKKVLRTVQAHLPWLVPLKNLLYHFVRSRLHLPHERGFAVIAHLPRSEVDLFLDVGGNRGQSILSIRSYRPEARIVSFEPNNRIFAGLREHFGADLLVTLHNFGLAAVAGERTLYEPVYAGLTYDGNASFHRDSAQTYLGPSVLYGFKADKLTLREHVCRTLTLDSLDLAPTFIKIDVEGFELDVLLGAQSTLRRHTPVLLIERYWKNVRVFDLLSGLGYVEVSLVNKRLVAQPSTDENAILMTLPRLRACSGVVS